MDDRSFRRGSLALHGLTLAALALMGWNYPSTQPPIDQEARDTIETITQTQALQTKINSEVQRSFAGVEQTLRAQCQINNMLLHENVECPKEPQP